MTYFLKDDFGNYVMAVNKEAIRSGPRADDAITFSEPEADALIHKYSRWFGIILTKVPAQT